MLPFPDVTTLGDAITRLPVEMSVTDTDLFTLTYPDTISLIRELKGLGASAAAIRGRKNGLYGRSLIKQLEQEYATLHSTEDGQIRATFEALYAQAWYKKRSHGTAGKLPIPIQQAGESWLVVFLLRQPIPEAGKTWVSTSLTRSLLAAGIQVKALKPVACGLDSKGEQ